VQRTRTLVHCLRGAQYCSRAGNLQSLGRESRRTVVQRTRNTAAMTAAGRVSAAGRTRRGEGRSLLRGKLDRVGPKVLYAVTGASA